VVRPSKREEEGGGEDRKEGEGIRADRLLFEGRALEGEGKEEEVVVEEGGCRR